jgi:hypothetical protein
MSELPHDSDGVSTATEPIVPAAASSAEQQAAQLVAQRLGGELNGLSVDGLIARLDREGVLPAEHGEELLAKLDFAETDEATTLFLAALVEQHAISETQLRDAMSTPSAAAESPVADSAPGEEEIGPSRLTMQILFVAVFAAGWLLSRLVGNDFLDGEYERAAESTEVAASLDR